MSRATQPLGIWELTVRKQPENANPAKPVSASDRRKARLAEALKTNLKRRKTQAKQRSATPNQPPEP